MLLLYSYTLTYSSLPISTYYPFSLMEVVLKPCNFANDFFGHTEVTRKAFQFIKTIIFQKMYIKLMYELIWQIFRHHFLFHKIPFSISCWNMPSYQAEHNNYLTFPPFSLYNNDAVTLLPISWHLNLCGNDRSALAINMKLL